ncbi:cation transporter [Carboxylicivirga sp. N1Y90]|uniref:cation transporter n=1 Tax=Carboxylicivirga fragile TaxID=3417571 RepID=UPI003D353860|nr:cation transporter [Marinilabiliaceae bacterium N1Y90]
MSISDTSIEKKAITVSMLSALSFSILGFGFSLFSSSQAVLLDAAFNLISAVTVFFGLKISNLVNAPISFKRPAGYVALEPLYILIKGFIVFGLTSFVVVSNIILLLNGGNELKLGAIIIYLLVALVGNIITYLYLKVQVKKTDSPIVLIETENWMINTLITASIAASFVAAFLLKDGFLSPYIKYMDQVVVIAVGLLTISVPIRAMNTGTKELLLSGQDEATQLDIEKLIDNELEHDKIERYKAYILKTGRRRWVTVYLTPSQKNLQLTYSDKLKGRITKAISTFYSNVDVEIILTERA